MLRERGSREVRNGREMREGRLSEGEVREGERRGI